VHEAMEISAGNDADDAEDGGEFSLSQHGPDPENQEYRSRRTWRGQIMVSYEVIRSGAEGPDDQQVREALMDKKYPSRNMIRRDMQPVPDRYRRSARAG
jgi:hypothetical protein